MIGQSCFLVGTLTLLFEGGPKGIHSWGQWLNLFEWGCDFETAGAAPLVKFTHLATWMLQGAIRIARWQFPPNQGAKWSNTLVLEGPRFMIEFGFGVHHPIAPFSARIASKFLDLLFGKAIRVTNTWSIWAKPPANCLGTKSQDLGQRFRPCLLLPKANQQFHLL